MPNTSNSGSSRSNRFGRHLKKCRNEEGHAKPPVILPLKYPFESFQLLHSRLCRLPMCLCSCLSCVNTRVESSSFAASCQVIIQLDSAFFALRWIRIAHLLLQPLGWRSLNVRFTTNGMCAKNITHIYGARTSNNRVIPMEWSWLVTFNNACEPGEQLIALPDGNHQSDLVGWSLLLLAATVWSFAHLPLGLSDRNTIFKSRWIILFLYFLTIKYHLLFYLSLLVYFFPVTAILVHLSKYFLQIFYQRR